MPAVGRDLVPRAVGRELPREHVVGEVELEHLGEAGAQPGVGDRRERLDAAVEVAGHEVGRTDEVLGGFGVGAEAVHPGVLEEATDDRPHADVLGQAGHAAGAGSRCRARRGRSRVPRCDAS